MVAEPPTANEFEAELRRILSAARAQGRTYVDIRAGDLHHAIGGYPGANHRMPVVVATMRSVAAEMRSEELEAPPKGVGASVRIRYFVQENSGHYQTSH